MAHTLPTSWQIPGQCKELQDYAPRLFPAVVGAIPAGKKIYFDEVMQAPTASDDARLSINVPSAAVMQWFVSSETIDDVALMKILTETLLGGYSNVDGKRHTPCKHPWYPGLYCKDIVSIKHLGLDLDNPIDSVGGPTFGQYETCIITLNFESLTYNVSGSNGAVNPNWWEITQTYGANRVTAPLGYYIFVEGEKIGFPALNGSFYYMPTGVINITIHQVLPVWYTGVGNGEKCRYSDFVGQINTDVFLGFPVKTLLLESIDRTRYYNWGGQELYSVKLQYRYNAWTWVRQIDPVGALRRVAFNRGGAEPFLNFNMGAMFNGLNPL